MSLQQKIISHNQNPGLLEPKANPGSDIMEENATYTSTLFSGEMSSNQKILGVSWNPVCDTLVFDICATANALRALKPTKRNVVGFSSKFYDPLGFLSPAIISLKIYFQELCKAKIESPSANNRVETENN